MVVRIQSVHFTADQKLINFIQKKMDKLDTFYDKIVDADVFLKLENTSTRENKIVEIKVNIPGNDLVVKKIAASFEEATDMCADVLSRQLRKTKEKVKMA
ncbi:MAG: ribosome hibernation-promoting factor, HPF/YfiA family [Thermaurantimonas sp.]